MRTEQLEYVAAIARLGSFRRASEELKISQPALSETVRNLERELGVEIFDRDRTGASISDDGRELLTHVSSVLDAVDELRQAAGQSHRASRMVRLATVNAGTVPILTPAIRGFRETHTGTQVEVVGAQADEIHRGLRAGSFDLGLLTCLPWDEAPSWTQSTTLIVGRPVVCLRPDDPLAARQSIPVTELLQASVIAMRTGYLMHRYLLRLLDGRALDPAFSTDGAEMGKLMVAEGLGITLLPDFSVLGDPLHRAGVITCRPISDDPAGRVHLVVRRRASTKPGRSAQELRRQLIDQAQEWQKTVPVEPAPEPLAP